jgi:DNA-binding SARP family transcriptional activator/Tfp pilus assembly protein PilF
MLEHRDVSRPRVPPSGIARRPDLATNRMPRQPLVRIHLLGSLRATTYLGDNILPRGRKARALLAYLCLSAGEQVARSRLSSLLWERVQDRQARASFRQALRELSSAIGSLANELIESTLHTVRLEPRLCWIDAVAVLSSDPLPPNTFRGDLASICAGELLEDLSGITDAFDQWLLAQRTRFTEQLRLLFETELKQLSEVDAPPDRRASLARRLIAFDATHEGASRVLMRALVDMGERAQALREYERCRVALRAALDVEPSAETRAFYEAVRAFIRPRKHDSPTPQQKDQKEQKEEKSYPLPHADRLRLGVLPFHGEGAARTENLAFSLSQEIAAALARFRWFDVIAPVSLMAMPPGVSGEDFLRSKQLHYIVGGSVSGDEEKFQISVRLMDVTQDSRSVWNDRFELSVNALDRMNDLIAAPVAARIDPVILFIEGQPARRQCSGATGLVLQAIPLLYSMERAKYEDARVLLSQALEIDPNNAMATAWSAFWYLYYVGQGWTQQVKEFFAEAQKLAINAIKIDPENAEALGIHAHICAFVEKDFDSAVHYFDRALRVNPNVAFIWAMSAPTYCYIGQPDEALRRLDRYRDLAPFDPHFRFWENAYTIAYTFKGEYEKAVSVGRRAVRANSEFSNGYKPLIAALGHLGRREEAAPYIEKLLSLEPNFTVEKFGKTYPARNPEDRERYMKGLLLAGVPAA